MLLFVVTLVSESTSGLDVWLCHSVAVTVDRWMIDLRFNNLFNSISVISGQLEVDYERLCAMEPHLRLKTVTRTSTIISPTEIFMTFSICSFA